MISGTGKALPCADVERKAGFNNERHYTEEHKLEAYRAECKDEALDLLKEYFYSLWT